MTYAEKDLERARAFVLPRAHKPLASDVAELIAETRESAIRQVCRFIEAAEGDWELLAYMIEGILSPPTSPAVAGKSLLGEPIQLPPDPLAEQLRALKDGAK